MVKLIQIRLVKSLTLAMHVNLLVGVFLQKLLHGSDANLDVLQQRRAVVNGLDNALLNSQGLICCGVAIPLFACVDDESDAQLLELLCTPPGQGAQDDAVVNVRHPVVVGPKALLKERSEVK